MSRTLSHSVGVPVACLWSDIHVPLLRFPEHVLSSDSHAPKSGFTLKKMVISYMWQLCSIDILSSLPHSFLPFWISILQLLQELVDHPLFFM